MPEGLLKKIDNLVEKGIYSNKSDVVRDAVRRLVLEKQIGSIPDTGDSVKEIRELRKRLSREKTDLKRINRLGE